MTDESPWIINTDDESFERDLIDRSRETLVVADFWAQWCHPCRLLAPTLAKLADDFAGKFTLVKIDVDAAPQATAAFGIDAFPTVVALRDGKPVDYFQGVMPEAEVRQWIERLLPSKADQVARAAREQFEADPAAAEEQLQAALADEPDSIAAKAALIELFQRTGRANEANGIIADLEARGYLEPEIERLKAALDVQQQAQDLGSIDDLRTAAAADEANLERQFRLAEALAANQEYEESLRIALRIVQEERAGVGEQARQLMLDVFKLLGDDALTTKYQRKLSLALS